MGHKTREEYKQCCTCYLFGWCCLNTKMGKHKCNCNCDRMKNYDKKHK